MVCTDYVTKWVEVRALTRGIEQVVSDFLFQDIFVLFGIPREIVTDGGPQFTSHLIKKLVEKYGIHHRTPHPIIHKKMVK